MNCEIDKKMTGKVLGDFGTLMRLAHALGTAKKSKDPVAIAKAQLEHDDYRDICLASDGMNLGVPNGIL